MKALALLPLALLGCSVDWTLARSQPLTGDASAPSIDDGGAADLLIRCNQVPSLAAPPVIDGVLEPNLSLLPWLDPAAPHPTGVAAMVAVAYRPDGVYFYVDVEDPTRDPAPLDALSYCGDGIELYVDADGVLQAPPAYDDPGTIQLIVAGPVDSVTPSHRGQRFRYSYSQSMGIELGDWTGDFIAVPTARGYAVEAFVVAHDLDLMTWTLAPGGKIGWNLSLNIGGPEDAGIDACTTRSQQLHFHLASSGACTAPYCNASAFCTPTLATP
jgi:hypothetical protein